MKTRFIKTVKTTQSEIESHEQRVNDVIRSLAKHGAVIVSITHTPFGISPMYLVCNIVYESEDVITGTNMEGENHERR